MTKQTLIHETTVHSRWLDYNGHMNDAAYAKVFSIAGGRVMDLIGLDAEARASYDYTMFTLEHHICYLKEVHETETLRTSVQLLDRDAKRIHLFFEMKNKAGDIVATSEQMLMGIDSVKRKSAPFPAHVEQAVQKMWTTHKELPVPKLAGSKIGIKRKS
ncbi:thioesterase family protein [Planococcus salinus]|uniref:Thioesterase n=1 Tax=Planococcus salinus TaxID=1848460 RepID=A0A3M8P7J8_9BACL|nr:thioesterase family protein [Planococcus salinus]RNF39668.1 thioesterase [Planococcus salinus]